MEPLVLLQYLGEALAVASAVAVVIVYLRSQTQKKTIEELKALCETLTQRLDLETAERERYQARVEKVEHENDVLRNIVTGEAKVTELTAKVHDLHRETMDVLKQIANKIAA